MEISSCGIYILIAPDYSDNVSGIGSDGRSNEGVVTEICNSAVARKKKVRGVREKVILKIAPRLWCV